MIVKTNVQAVGRRHKEKGETWVAAKSSAARFYRRGTQGVSFLFCRRWDPQAMHLFRDFIDSLSENTVQENVKKNQKKYKNRMSGIDESSGKIYIHFHRRNTAALLFDRSGKEITD